MPQILRLMVFWANSLTNQSYRRKLLDGLVASLALTPIPAKKLLNSLKVRR